MRSGAAEIEVGPYRLLEPLGGGEAGEVYRARHRGGFPLDVALHVLDEHLARDERLLQKFLDEAALARRLDHPCAARVYDAGRDGDRVYLAAELTAGPRLSEMRDLFLDLRRTPPLRVLVRILCGVCEGLHHAHELVDERGDSIRLVHGAVTASAVTVAASGTPKITGFGLAAACAAARNAGDERVDRREDLRALALLCRELLAQEGQDPRQLTALAGFLDRADRVAHPTALAMRLDLEEALAASGTPVVEHHVASLLKELASISSGDATRRDVTPALRDLRDPADETDPYHTSDTELGIELGPVQLDPLESGAETTPGLEMIAPDPEPTVATSRPATPSPAPVLVRFFSRDDSSAEDTTSTVDLIAEESGQPLYDEHAAEHLSAVAAGPDSETDKARLRRRISGLIERAAAASARGEHASAVVAVDLALREHSTSAVAQKLISEGRGKLLAVCRAYLGRLSLSPALTVGLEDLPLDEIDHRIAFLLSHVNGVLTLEEVLSVCGMSELEALRYLSLLKLHGVLEV